MSDDPWLTLSKLATSTTSSQPGLRSWKLGDDRLVSGIAFGLQPVPPRAAAVASLHPAIEIPDSRYADFASVGAFSLIADNACAHEFVLGPPAPPDWRSRDLATHPVRATVVGKLVRDGCGANVLGDPRIALAWLVNEVSALGVTLRAGETVTTGTSATPLPIAPGDALHADFGPLGAVGLKFQDR